MKTYLSIFFVLFYIVTTHLYRKNNKKEQTKKPLVFTKRVRRLTYTMIFLYFILIMGICINYKEEYLSYYYLILGLSIYLNYFVVTADCVSSKGDGFLQHCREGERSIRRY